MRQNRAVPDRPPPDRPPPDRPPLDRDGSSVETVAPAPDTVLTEPLSVLMVSGSMVCGGLEVYASRLSVALARRGHRVLFGCREGSWLQQRLLRDDIAHRFIAPRSSGDLLATTRMALELVRGGYQIIHAHKAKDHVPVLAAGRLARRAVVFTRHDMMEMSRWSFRATAAADRVIAVSDAVRERQIELGLPHDKITTLLTGIDTQRFQPRSRPRERLLEYRIAEDTPTLALVARIQGGKRVDTFIDAAALIHAARPDVRFLVVGDGPDRGLYEFQAAQQGLGSVVIFTGHCNDVEAILPEVDALVLASYTEAFSLVVVEAMACGIPVISTPVEGPRSILEEGRTGLFFPVGDAPALAAAMTTILNDRRRGRMMGRAGRQVVMERYNEKRMVDESEAIYLEVLRRRQRK